jgi:hypothetical protein
VIGNTREIRVREGNSSERQGAAGGEKHRVQKIAPADALVHS